MTQTRSNAGRRLGAGLLFLAVAAGVVLWQIGAFDRNSRQGDSTVGSTALPEAREQPSPMITRVARRQFESFAVLRTRPEGLPPSVTRALRAPIYGMNWTLAQKLPVDAVGVRLWAVPGHDAICILGQEKRAAVIATCATTHHAVREGVATVLLRAPGRPESGRAPSRRLVAGLAPDHARTMRIYTRQSIATAHVFDGTFTLEDASMDSPDRITVGATHH
jgi:hypothetical protein